MVAPDRETVQRVSLQAFVEFVERPENADRQFELINGEIIEVSPSRTRNAEFPMILAFYVLTFSKAHQISCHTSGADGAYNIDGNIAAPDFAYKTTSMSNEYPDPEPPLWVVEVISPTDKVFEIRNKRQVYVQAGIVYWELYPEAQSIDIYAPNQPMRTVNIEEVLDCGDLLPGFTLPMKDLFE